MVATLDWAPHFLFLGISAFFKKKVCKQKRSKNWSKSSKHLCDLAKIGQKRDQKSRLFSGFLMITRSRLKIAIYKGARLWNLRTRRTFWHLLTLIILCVGGAPDLQKTPFFQPERVTLKRWLRFHNIKLFWLKFRTYTTFNQLNPKKWSLVRSHMF